MITFRQLKIEDAVNFRRVRLHGLQESPDSFGSSFEEERLLDLDEYVRRLENSQNNCVFGAFDDEELIGMVGFRRDYSQKTRHNGFLWGVYVLPEQRGSGVAKNLLEFALKTIEAFSDIRNVRLGVAVKNIAAVRLYEKLGFVRYALDEEAFVVEGVFQAEYLMTKKNESADK